MTFVAGRSTISYNRLEYYLYPIWFADRLRVGPGVQIQAKADKISIIRNSATFSLPTVKKLCLLCADKRTEADAERRNSFSLHQPLFLCAACAVLTLR